MKKVILMLIVIMINCVFLSADVYIKIKTHTGAMMGQAATDVIVEQWIASDKLANVSKGQNTIIDLVAKKLIIVYDKTKSYVETPLPPDMKKILPAQLLQMMSMMKMTVTVTPGTETKKIGEWNCKKYTVVIDMTVMKMTMTAWCTLDVSFDWKSYQEKLFSVQMSTTMPMIDAASIAEFKKLEGLQVASEISLTVMGQATKITSEVVEISKKEAPAGIYSIPEGYKKQDKMNAGTGM